MTPNGDVSEALGADPGQNALFATRPFAGQDDAPRCGCAVCCGAATIQDFGLGAAGGNPLSYLNADERAQGAVGGKPSFSIDRAGLQLTGFDPVTMAPAPGWGGVAGAAFTVTYAFRANAPLRMPTDTDGFQRFNVGQILQAEQALLAWSDVANIRFVRVGSGTDGEAAYSDEASILLSNYSSGTAGTAGPAGFAYYPGSTRFGSSSGDVWINIGAGSNAFASMGNYGGQVLIHELGHAIGLAHPGVYNSDGDTKFSYAVHAEYYEDSRQYTVMSYFSETNTGGNFRGSFASVPLLDDIRGAQIEYGANMSTRTGDTVYGFNATADRAWFSAANSSTRLIFAVWDAGGRDTFDFSGYSQAQLIDLREGFFSNVGGLTGNVAIAQGVQIENARGGFGADTVNGNASANEISGNAGNDRIFGNAGNDRIFGGAGDDTIDGGSGANYLRGEEGNDSIVGGASFDDIHGNMGDDTASGGGGDDWVVGGKGNDWLFGDDGADLVYGNLGNDTLDGGTGADTVRGGQGDDVLNGGSGADFISGDRGSDTVTGGAGADIFHSFTGSGIDRILDFNQAEGDWLQLAPGNIFSVAQVGADTVVTLGVGDQVILVGVQMSSLTDGWIFGF